ncbi:MAG: hypothetical protein IH586_01085 [Anaerolineaceae bacterium]|nr:hypothetical protein [Anaerolineaceae bacterium]
MDTPVYKLFFFKRGAKALGLSAKKYQAVLAETREPARRLGVRHMLVANMRWSNEQRETFGIELFPSLEVEQEYVRTLEELGWYNYVDSESYLGIPMDSTANNITPPEPPSPGENSVYRVYLSRLTDYGHGLSPDQLNGMWAQGREALNRVHGRMLIGGYMRFNNEEWESFGVERFPNQEAVLAYSQFLSVSGWYRVSLARSFLGTAIGGELVTGI